jgi:hypothetical protein
MKLTSNILNGSNCYKLIIQHKEVGFSPLNRKVKSRPLNTKKAGEVLKVVIKKT